MSTHIETEAGREASNGKTEVIEVDSGEKTRLLAAILAAELNSELNSGSEAEASMATAFEPFVSIVYHKPHPVASGFVLRRENYVLPILDVFIHWSCPIQFTREETAEMRELLAEHATSLHPFDQSFSSLLGFVDKRSYPTADALKSYLENGYSAGRSARLVAFATFRR